jgi:hypothetical protein
VIARVFPRRTVATPIDSLTFFKEPPRIGLPEIKEVHVSVAFTYDMAKAEWLAHQWGAVGVPVKMGGPAFNEKGGDFVSGMYLKKGYTITSRGCPNRCWFCSVPKREGYQIRELPIVDGFNVLDDNLLACSDDHIKAVFKMLDRQPEYPIFTGGLEAKVLKGWHCEKLKRSDTKRLYFAYDTPDDFEPLVEAGKMLRFSGFTTASHSMCAYVLVGYRGDTFEKAEQRLTQTIKAGFMPYAMLFKNEKGETDRTWGSFQREWCRPRIVAKKFDAVWKAGIT